MVQENCQLCRRDGATTPEIPATWVICTSSGAPLIYTCDDHLECAKKVVAERHGTALTYHVVLLTDDTEKMLQLARQRLPAKEQPLASARIKLKKVNKAGSNMGTCRVCRKRFRVAKREWDRAANPKCPACGGMLDREEQAMTPRELTRHERAMRRDLV